MTGRAEALRAFRASVVTLSELDEEAVIWDFGIAVRPSTVHLALQLIADVPLGQTQRDEPGSTTVWQQRQATVQVSAYGAADADAALSMLEGLALLVGSNAPAALGYHWQGSGAVRQLTTVVSSGYEPRAAFDVQVGYLVQVAAAPPAVVTSIVVEVAADDPGGDPVGTAEIDITPVWSA